MRYTKEYKAHFFLIIIQELKSSVRKATMAETIIFVKFNFFVIYF